MQRKTMFYQRFVNLIKGLVIIDFSTEHNLTSVYRLFVLKYQINNYLFILVILYMSQCDLQ